MPSQKGTNTLNADGWCDQCGQQHHPAWGDNGNPCWRHNKHGDPCKKAAMVGQNVCGTHGGRNPSAKANGQRRDAEQRAEAAIRRLIPDNPAPITDPIATLAALGGEVSAVRQAAAEALNKAFTANRNALDDFAVLAVYERTVDRLVRICESLVRSNYLERRAAVEEAEAVALLTAVQTGLRLIDDAALRARVTAAIAGGVRALSA